MVCVARGPYGWRVEGKLRAAISPSNWLLNSAGISTFDRSATSWTEGLRSAVDLALVELSPDVERQLCAVRFIGIERARMRGYRGSKKSCLTHPQIGVR